MSLPTLSVVTPSFNNGEFIEDAIQSVSQQQAVAVEHIVVDGASTDGTVGNSQALPVCAVDFGARTMGNPMPSTRDSCAPPATWWAG